MSQLILLRQRIKAIETIQKITHAMRLISMSSHAHLKSRQNSFEAYTKSLKKLLFKIQKTVSKSNAANAQLPTYPEKILVCVIGSQKGLCGTFNSALLHYFNQKINAFDQSQISLFLVGKKTIDALTPDYRQQIIAVHPTFSLRTMPDILAQLNDVMQAFDRVIVISNVLQSFFVQRPYMHTIMPLEEKDNGLESTKDDFSDYEWEVSAQDIFDNLIQEYKQTSIEHLLLQSLLAEHAARFIAMDNSTRNARTLLEEKKLEYNKLRQAKITKELTELSGIFTL